MTKNDIFYIAEIGINHNGSVDIAKMLMDMSKAQGCSAVKFQKRNVEKIIPKDLWYKDKETPWGYMKYIDYKKKLELGKVEYDEIDRYSKEIGLPWFASAWDDDSLYFLKRYDLPYNKIASPMASDFEFVRAVAKEGKKTFASTGMSSWEEIDKVREIFEEEKCPLVIMHCTSKYPCPYEDLNISCIPEMVKRYPCEVGYSSHFIGIVDIPIAIAIGARYIEKHITLDRAMWGSDQSASIEKTGLSRLIRDGNIVHKMLGNTKKQVKKESVYNRNNSNNSSKRKLQKDKEEKSS